MVQISSIEIGFYYFINHDWKIFFSFSVLSSLFSGCLDHYCISLRISYQWKVFSFLSHWLPLSIRLQAYSNEKQNRSNSGSSKNVSFGKKNVLKAFLFQILNSSECSSCNKCVFILPCDLFYCRCCHQKKRWNKTWWRTPSTTNTMWKNSKQLSDM